MDANRTRAIAEVVGITAIVASLLLLTYELNQSNRLATANAIHDLVQNYNQINVQILSDPEVAELYMMLRNPDQEYTGINLERVQAIAQHQVNNWDWINAAYREGLISRPTYETNIKGAVLNLQRYPGLKPYVASIIETYPSPTGSDIQRALLEASQH